MDNLDKETISKLKKDGLAVVRKVLHSVNKETELLKIEGELKESLKLSIAGNLFKEFAVNVFVESDYVFYDCIATIFKYISELKSQKEGWEKE